MSRSPEQILTELGLALPAVPAPIAAYVPAVRTGDLVYTSGQLPMVDGQLITTGIVGDSVSLEAAQACARQCVLNALAAVRGQLDDLSAVARIVKLTAFVASGPGFTQHSLVANGASELLGQVFQDAGSHARSAVGVSALPLGAPVEIELVVEVR